MYIEYYLALIFDDKILSILKMAESSTISCLQDIEDYASKILPKNALDYYKCGADQMHTLKENRNAFQK